MNVFFLSLFSTLSIVWGKVVTLKSVESESHRAEISFFLSFSTPPAFSFSSPHAPPSPLFWSLSGHQPAFDLSVCLSRDVKKGAAADVQLVGLRRVILGKSVCSGTSNGERE